MLSDEQTLFINLAITLKQGRFLTLNGSAGTGKTFTINEFCSQIGNVLVCAPTARAGALIKGSTLHKAFGIPSGICNPNFETYRLPAQRSVNDSCKYFGKARKEPIKQCSWILIDEYSMVRCDHFDWVDAAAQEATGVREPFGGKKLALVGDNGQLGPVADEREAEALERLGYEFPFDVTKSRVWRKI